MRDDDAAVDAAELAGRAGLRHLPDDRPGLARRRRGRGFSYYGTDGALITADAERDRVEALAIPPAWSDVWIAPEPDAHLLATGRDERGRKQYLYHPDWRAVADLDKFERLASVGRSLADLRERVDLDLRTRGPDWPIAALVRLIDDSLIRPGSLRNLEANGSVGATTLAARHIRIDGRHITLDFEGKASIEQHVEFEDSLLARRLSSIIDDCGDGELIVGANESTIDPGELNEYIATHSGCDMTAKVLRTWGATCVVAEHLMASDGGEPDELVRDAVESAAERLGNTAVVCRRSYVAPSVIDAYASGDLEAAWRRSRRAKWLSRIEQAVRRVLERE